MKTTLLVYLGLCLVIGLVIIAFGVYERLTVKTPDHKFGYLLSRNGLFWWYILFLATPIVNIFTLVVVLYLFVSSPFIKRYENGLKANHFETTEVNYFRTADGVLVTESLGISRCSCGLRLSETNSKVQFVNNRYFLSCISCGNGVSSKYEIDLIQRWNFKNLPLCEKAYRKLNKLSYIKSLTRSLGFLRKQRVESKFYNIF